MDKKLKLLVIPLLLVGGLTGCEIYDPNKNEDDNKSSIIIDFIYDYSYVKGDGNLTVIVDLQSEGVASLTCDNVALTKNKQYRYGGTIGTNKIVLMSTYLDGLVNGKHVFTYVTEGNYSKSFNVTVSGEGGVVPPDPGGKQYVTNYNLADGITYTGYIDENNIPCDSGVLTYSNGDVLTIVFTNGLSGDGHIAYANEDEFEGDVSLTASYQFSRVNGEMTFANGQYYKGKFINNLYDDDCATFSYSYFDFTTFSIVHDMTYIGGFSQGSVNGQIGKLVMPAYEEKANDSLWYVAEVTMQEEKVPVANQACTYMYRYDNWAYEGDGYCISMDYITFPSGTYHGKKIFDPVNPAYVGCYYEGEFMNGVPHGQGKFVWDLDKYTFMEGTWVNGSVAGQKVKKYFTPYYDLSDLGCVWYEGICKNEDGTPQDYQQCEGQIRYPDHSVYTGGLYFSVYDSAHPGGDWRRNGFGIQDCTDPDCAYSGSWLTNIGGAYAFVADKYMAYFEGQFSKNFGDEGGWIDGNMIFYFFRADGVTPYGYLTGKFRGWERVGDYEGELPTLREGFTINLNEDI